MMKLCRMYSFLGRSTGILGHGNINNRSIDESNDESLMVNLKVFDGQLFELTMRGRDFNRLKMVK